MSPCFPALLSFLLSLLLSFLLSFLKALARSRATRSPCISLYLPLFVSPSQLSLKAGLLEMERIYITLESELSVTSTLVDQLLQAVERYGAMESSLRGMVAMVQVPPPIYLALPQPPPCPKPCPVSRISPPLADPPPRPPRRFPIVQRDEHEEVDETELEVLERDIALLLLQLGLSTADAAQETFSWSRSREALKANLNKAVSTPAACCHCCHCCHCSCEHSA